MLLKLNKEGPFKKDVFRAPGHQVCSKFIEKIDRVSLREITTFGNVINSSVSKVPK